MSISIPEVVRELNTLPPERIAEVYDFVLFLKTRPRTPVDVSDEWSEQDMKNVTTAALGYAEATLLDEAEADEPG